MRTKRSQQRLRRELMKNQARANLTCACGKHNHHRVNYAGTGFARRFSSRKRSTDRFAKIIARQSFREYFGTALRAVSRLSVREPATRLRWAPAGSLAGGYSRLIARKLISLCARISAGTARAVFLSQPRDRCRPVPPRLWTS